MTINEYCKRFRKEVLKKTLNKVSFETDVRISTISAFENGRSQNMNHLAIYIKACDSEQQKEVFFNGLIEQLNQHLKAEVKRE